MSDMNPSANYEEHAALVRAHAEVDRLRFALRNVAAYAEGRQHSHAALTEVADADAAIGFARVMAIANAALETR